MMVFVGAFRLGNRWRRQARSARAERFEFVDIGVIGRT